MDEDPDGSALANVESPLERATGYLHTLQASIDRVVALHCVCVGAVSSSSVTHIVKKRLLWSQFGNPNADACLEGAKDAHSCFRTLHAQEAIHAGAPSSAQGSHKLALDLSLWQLLTTIRSSHHSAGAAALSDKSFGNCCSASPDYSVLRRSASPPNHQLTHKPSPLHRKTACHHLPRDVP